MPILSSASLTCFSWLLGRQYSSSICSMALSCAASSAPLSSCLFWSTWQVTSATGLHWMWFSRYTRQASV
ncbi:hypothetical protein DPMN_015660 [Dreissena polymorpha]|uniref:Uncharacterized protein n=1 Tax=Dreissena polymorpha TaxID=45954 RepID=A0A9D4S4M7_DREPO|nr:hypothetical protein DPMN_015660 [Dreissena polymorpha]